MQCYPLRKVRGLGGKLGHQLIEIYQSLEPHLLPSSNPEQGDLERAAPSTEEKPDLTASAFLHRCGIDDLAKRLGREMAVFVHRVCSGDDGGEPVNEKKLEVKAFSSVKQFDSRSGSALVRVEQLEYWTRIIAEEVILRCEDERVENKRFPTQLILRYGRENEKPHTRTLSIAQDTVVDDLHTATMNVMRQHLDAIFPLAYLTMSAKGFMALDSRGVSSISSFFTKVPAAGGSKAESIENELKLLAPPSSNTGSSSTASKKQKISAFFTPTNGVAGTDSDSGSSASHLVGYDLRRVEDAHQEETEPSTSTCTSVEDPDHAAAPFHCDKCGKRVCDPRDEHEDFHFALELSRAERASIESAVAGVGSAGAGAKRKKPAGGGPLDAFVTKAARKQ